MTAPDLASTLHRVDELVQCRLSDLAEQWAELNRHRVADVLGDQDVPALIATMCAGGKQIRPAMCHWGWVAVGGQLPEQHEDIVRVGAALELLHLFALIHDDIMDASPVRRGQPTIHVRAADRHRDVDAAGSSEHFGEAIAMLAGDLAHAQAEWLLADASSVVRAEWQTMVTELVLGQRRDLTGAARRRRDLEHALSVAQVKSGAYTTQRPLRLGALIGGASELQLSALTEYGRLVGEAFALRDDLLGVWGDPALTGKPAGDDLEQGKATVLLALARDRLAEPDQRLLARVGQHLPADDRLHLVSAMERAEVPEQVEALIADLIDQALSTLSETTIDAAARDGLVTLAQQLAWRNS